MAAGINFRGDPRQLAGRIPSGQSLADQPEDVRADAKLIADWTIAHVQNARAERDWLERLWIRVESYMLGFHFFELDATGQWRSTPLKEGEVRATRQLMRSKFRRELGRFTENVLTVQALAASPNNPQSFYKARRAELIINAWQEETQFADTYEDWASQQLHYGLSALHYYKDPRSQQVLSEAWSAVELYPIPWDARKDNQLQGLCRSKPMSKAWIEEFLGPIAAQKAGKMRVGRRAGNFLSGAGVGGKTTDEQAGQVTWVWILPTSRTQNGQHYILVEDEMFAYVDKADPDNGIEPPLRNGRFPVQLSRYSKQQDNWYGMGLLPTLIGAQAEADRQMSTIVRSSALSSGMLFINEAVLNMADVQDADQTVIAYDEGAYDAHEEFFRVIPPIPVSRDVGAVLALSTENADLAAGHESDIIRGKAEGRVESGPAARLLNVNAQAPIAPVLGTMYRGLRQHYGDVLDMTGEVWPDEKLVRVVGRYDVVDEMMIRREEVPASADVVFRPAPLLPAGRTEMFNLLLQLRQTPADDGKPEISSAEFRRGLAAIGMSPPGLELASAKDQRIRQRVGELFGDGKTPGASFSDAVSEVSLKLEDPDALGAALIDFMLQPGFNSVASPQVQAAFLQALQLVRTLKLGDPSATQGFDDNLDIRAHDALKSEEFLDAAEQNPETLDGQMVVDGLPLGV